MEDKNELNSPVHLYSRSQFINTGFERQELKKFRVFLSSDCTVLTLFGFFPRKSASQIWDDILLKSLSTKAA